MQRIRLHSNDDVSCGKDPQVSCVFAFRGINLCVIFVIMALLPDVAAHFLAFF
jgi:hypothetical protein